jgi:hypothetical protein
VPHRGVKVSVLCGHEKKRATVDGRGGVNGSSRVELPAMMTTHPNQANHVAFIDCYRIRSVTLSVNPTSKSRILSPSKVSASSSTSSSSNVNKTVGASVKTIAGGGDKRKDGRGEEASFLSPRYIPSFSACSCLSITHSVFCCVNTEVYVLMIKVIFGLGKHMLSVLLIIKHVGDFVQQQQVLDCDGDGDRWVPLAAVWRDGMKQ